MGSVNLIEDDKPIKISLEGGKLIIEMDAPEGLTMEKLGNKANPNSERGFCGSCGGIRSACASAIID